MVAPKKITTGRVSDSGVGSGDLQKPGATRSRRDKLRRMFQVDVAPAAGAQPPRPSALGQTPSEQQLDRTQLDRAQLNRAQLNRAQLDRAQLNRAQLDRAQLDRTQLDRAQLDRRSLDQTLLDQTQCASGHHHQSAPELPARGNIRAFLQARRDRLAAGMPANLSRPVVELPPADILATEHGPLWRRELRYPASHNHGRIKIDSGRHFDRERLAKMAKSPSFTELRAEQCLFLDTETTGLSGGAGTMVFAYGIAFYEGDEFVLEQLFLRDFGEEPAMLHHIAKRLAEHPVPVTFVGKSYDRHRIAARLAVHKIKAPILTDRHLDLYHVIRREFGKSWPNSRLHTAEERLLGLYRDDDLPGSEAPAAFLDWIRDRTGPVDRVLEHNRLDVLSLAALLGVVTLPGAQIADV
ncbi:MAG: hypothetical protein ACI8UD_003116 [Planctomycetota bacterium]